MKKIKPCPFCGIIPKPYLRYGRWHIEFAESKKGGASEKKAEEAEEFVNVSSDELPFT